MKRWLAGAICAVLAVIGTPEASAAAAASCHTGRRAFPWPLAVPGQDQSHVPTSDRFAALTATRHGLWAGYAFSLDPSRFAVISWRAGQRHATVLKRFRFKGTFLPSHPGSVTIAGITVRGAVVATVKRNDLIDTYPLRTSAFAFYRGHTYRLARRANWYSVAAEGVSDSGRIFGLVSAGTMKRPHFYMVTWASPKAKPKVVIDLGRYPTRPQITGRGDIVYDRENGAVDVGIRFASGKFGILASPDGSSVQVSSASGNFVYGSTSRGIAQWDLRSADAHGVVRPRRLLGPIDPDDYGRGVIAASPRGDVIIDRPSRSYLRTAAGAVVKLPKLIRNGDPSGAAVKANGKTVAVTLKRDGLVHFVRCR